jgi:hypothetical protein
MKKELNYLSSKKWEKVGRQELRSTPCKQEIDPWSLSFTFSTMGTFQSTNISPQLRWILAPLALAFKVPLVLKPGTPF